MELGHLLTRSGHTYPEVSSKVYHDSFCKLGSSVSLPWVINFGAFYLRVVKAKGSNPTAGLTLLWARNSFRGNINHWQVSPNIIRVIKSKECNGQGRVARMGHRRGMYSVLVGKHEGKRPLGGLNG